MAEVPGYQDRNYTVREVACLCRRIAAEHIEAPEGFVFHHCSSSMEVDVWEEVVVEEAVGPLLVASDALLVPGSQCY